MFLGIETSGDTTRVALVEGERLLYEESSLSGVSHNEVLVGMIRSALRTVAGQASDLAGIGVTIGPGMFTSLRVGLAVAKGLAVGLGVPMKGVSTFAALSAAAGEDKTVLSLVEARKNEVYAAVFQNGGLLFGPAVVGVDRLVGWLSGAGSFNSARPTGESGLKLPVELVLAGNAVQSCSPVLRELAFVFRDSGVVSPPARVVARLAARLLDQSGPDEYVDMEPIYLRRTDAELRMVPQTGWGSDSC